MKWLYFLAYWHARIQLRTHLNIWGQRNARDTAAKVFSPLKWPQTGTSWYSWMIRVRRSCRWQSQCEGHRIDRCEIGASPRPKYIAGCDRAIPCDIDPIAASLSLNASFVAINNLRPSSSNCMRSQVLANHLHNKPRGIA